jgi:hypothetical protein
MLELAGIISRSHDLQYDHRNRGTEAEAAVSQQEDYLLDYPQNTSRRIR